MTPEQLAAIEERAEATPKGPWFVEYFGDAGYPQRVENHQAILIADTHQGGTGLRPTPEFIAHARTDVPALVAEVKRLTAERDVNREFLGAEVAAVKAQIEHLAGEVRSLASERDSLKGLLSGSQQELRDAITAQGKAEQERDEALAGELAAARNEPGHALPEDRDHAIVAYFRLFLQWRHQRERADQAEAALDRVRSDALADAIEAVCGLQIRDASRLAEHHGHGGWCKGGTAPGMCHVAEAHATANRVLDTLRALDGSGT